MKTRHQKTVLAAVLSALLLCPAVLLSTPAQAADEPAAAASQAKPNWYPKRADLAFVKANAVQPKRDGVTLIDARPAARKYDIGHIPTAINIPDLQFDKLAPTLLPADKSQLLIFYCDGPECILSHNSAFRAEKLGYTNVRVYAEGFPDWIKGGNLHAVSVAQVKKLLDEKAPITLIDARPKDRKYDKGHIPGAINLPDSQFDKLAATLLPADRLEVQLTWLDDLTRRLVFTAHGARHAARLHDLAAEMTP